MRRALVLVLVLVFVFVFAAACATTLSTALDPGAGLVRSKCGGCHLSPGPGRSKHEWEAVLLRHRERVPLEAAERAAIVQHLSARP